MSSCPEFRDTLGRLSAMCNLLPLLCSQCMCPFPNSLGPGYLRLVALHPGIEPQQVLHLQEQVTGHTANLPNFPCVPTRTESI